MPGERNLDVLLRSISPVIHPGEFVYCSAPAMVGNPICAFCEAEGWTLILRRDDARRLGLDGAYPCRMITLTVHSSLDAVGLLAVVATRLAASGISVNVVSAYHHDHLFVPLDRAAEAMDVLREMARP